MFFSLLTLWKRCAKTPCLLAFTLRTRGPKVCTRETSRQTQRVSAFFVLIAPNDRITSYIAGHWRPGQNVMMFICASWHDSFLRQSYRFVETLDWFQRKFLLTLFQQSITKPNKLIVLKQRSQTVINCTTQNVIRKCKQSSPQFISYDIIMFAD